MPSTENISPSKKSLSGLSATAIGIVVGTVFIVMILADSLLIVFGQLEIGAFLGVLILVFGVYGAWLVFYKYRLEAATK
jgi:hypothetical protein